MSNMSYCRHENTSNDLQDVWDSWVNSHGYNTEGQRVNLSEYEASGRNQIIDLVVEMYQAFQEDGIITDDGNRVRSKIDLPQWSDEELGGDFDY